MAATNKNYKLPYTLFSSRKHPRIIDLFRMRNIENDLNDWQKHMETFFNEELSIAGKSGTVEFTASDGYVKTLTIDITKTGYDVIGITKIRADRNNYVVLGWDVKQENGVLEVYVMRLEHYLAEKQVMTNASASSTSTLNTSVTPNTVTTNTTITPTRITKTAESTNISVKIMYRKKYTAYAEKEA